MQRIPRHLQAFVANQDASLYTAIDHASWRYIMRVSKAFFAEHAYEVYLDGLVKTGISSERIPLVTEMDECLMNFGWGAVAVVGFIPPAVFMEFLSLGILPIACDMRKLENLAYTPAPDIVHEAAGHAPIIADPAYAAYLHGYGAVAPKAIYSDQDLAVYEAVRNLSDTKEDPRSTPGEVAAAQKRFEDAVAAVDHVSEATQLGRMGWWTFEYGLIGDLKAPKIYGAGLLSSVSESFNCLGASVKKIPFSVDCVHTAFDITRPQPQLFVTPDFETLTRALEEFASGLAFRRGGMEGLGKAKRARALTTAELDTGARISGKLTDVETDAAGEPAYLRYAGPVQLSAGGFQLDGQGADYHREGYGTPVGLLKGSRASAAELTPADLERLGFRAGRAGRLELASGVVLEGELSGRIEKGGKNLVLAFRGCTVSRGPEILFRPEWGTFDMACGARVVSVFGGAGDPGPYLDATGGFRQKPALQKTNLTQANQGLASLYARVRKIRESGRGIPIAELDEIRGALDRQFPLDWLLALELLELTAGDARFAAQERDLRARLSRLAGKSGDTHDMITRGLALLGPA